MTNMRTILALCVLFTGCVGEQLTCEDAVETAEICFDQMCEGDDGLWCECATSGLNVTGCACEGNIYDGVRESCAETGVQEFYDRWDCESITSWMIGRTAAVCNH